MTNKDSFVKTLVLILLISGSMKKHGVVPDIITAAPSALITVKYPSGVEVDNGNELTPTLVKDIPKVQWPAENGALYTLCMTDPDAPSRKNPKFREWHHWLVGNIPGNDMTTGETLSEYIGAAPPQNSGIHRYVILVYKQPGRLTFKEQKLTNHSGNNRGGFSISKFAAKYKMGNPIAGNLFRAQYDDYVPVINQQLRS